MADNELFPIVDENGNVLGKATRGECHSGVEPKLLHPVVHLHIVAPGNKILLQKRALNKDIQPGKWDTAVGGHVDYGEEIEAALKREAFEELGLSDIEPTRVLRYVFESNREKELVNVFAIVIENPEELLLNVSPEEIDEVRFWSREEIENAENADKLTPNFRSEFSNINDKLFALLP